MLQHSKIQERELSIIISSLVGDAIKKKNNKGTFEEIEIDAQFLLTESVQFLHVYMEGRQNQPRGTLCLNRTEMRDLVRRLEKAD